MRPGQTTGGVPGGAPGLCGTRAGLHPADGKATTRCCDRARSRGLGGALHHRQGNASVRALKAGTCLECPAGDGVAATKPSWLRRGLLSAIGLVWSWIRMSVAVVPNRRGTGASPGHGRHPPRCTKRYSTPRSRTRWKPLELAAAGGATRRKHRDPSGGARGRGRVAPSGPGSRGLRDGLPRSCSVPGFRPGAARVQTSA